MRSEEKRRKHAEYMRQYRHVNNERNRAYYREYNQRNKAHISELRKVAWLKKKGRVNAERRLRHVENPEKARAYDRLRWNLDKAKFKAKNKRSYFKCHEKRLASGEKYREEHPEVIRAWRKRNLDHLIDYNRNKRFPCEPYQFARGESCAFCSISNTESVKKYGRRLDVHHVDGNLLNNSSLNLLTVCRGCHMGIHSRQKNIPVVE